MIQNRKKKLGLIFMTFILMSLFIALITPSIKSKTVSDTITLYPLDEHFVSFKLHEGDTLYLTGTVHSGSIDIAIYDSENYPSSYYYEEYWSNIYSSFTRNFDAIWTDTFYVVFYNPDTTVTASLSFTIESETNFMTNTIINISLGAVFLGTVLVLNFSGKKNNQTQQ
ncbi:MAG TPA: hypothetical protein VMZ29_17050 [Candidatus Bathyarchaeia archaeon]|nr:hypothetical protein [Candidatus Bathyarchaeia archaeon]